MANEYLSEAKRKKNDEFYTQYSDIEKEISAYLEYNPDVFRDKTVLLPCDDPEWSNFTRYFAQNFDRFSLKKLISTSYAAESKTYRGIYQPTLFETENPKYDQIKTTRNGKIFTLTCDRTGDHKVNVDDLDWQYLQGDGDFRSEEVKKLRDESDIIITNPPFSMFREFLAWIIEANKQFLIIGNINAITYKDVFPLIKNNKMWTGVRFNKRLNGKNMTFLVPDDYNMNGTEVEIGIDGRKMISVAGTGWYTNLDHGRRHQPLPLMTMADNLKFSKHKEIKGKEAYIMYDNYDAIEVPYTDAIPSDYEGVMGVPISFLDKYNPDQFEIVGNGQTMADELGIKPVGQKFVDDYYAQGNKGQIHAKWNNLVYHVGEKVFVPYQRILIKHRR
jgi:hypothetical protein